jgi:hypothetical protein
MFLLKDTYSDTTGIDLSPTQTSRAIFLLSTEVHIDKPFVFRSSKPRSISSWAALIPATPPPIMITFFSTLMFGRFAK